MVAGPMVLVQIGGNGNADRHATDRAVGDPAPDPFGAAGCDCRRAADDGREQRWRFWNSRWRLRREGLAGSRDEETEKHAGAVRHRLYHLESREAAGIA